MAGLGPSAPVFLIRQDVASPIGDLVLVERDGALIVLAFAHRMPLSDRHLARHYPGFGARRGKCRSVSALQEYLGGNRAALKSISCSVRGTPFQKLVWDALASIPFGQTISYLQLAQQIGRPRAVRAVANAVGANPAAIVLPCHRVMGSSGSLTGFGGGLDKKRWLLAHEGVDV